MQRYGFVANLPGAKPIAIDEAAKPAAPAPVVEEPSPPAAVEEAAQDSDDDGEAVKREVNYGDADAAHPVVSPCEENLCHRRH